MHCTVPHCSEGLPSAPVVSLVTLGPCIVLYCTLLYSTVMYCTVTSCSEGLPSDHVAILAALVTYTVLYCMLLYFTTVIYCTLLLYYLPHHILHLHIESRENLCCGFSVMVVLQEAPGARRTMVTIRNLTIRNLKISNFATSVSSNQRFVLLTWLKLNWVTAEIKGAPAAP